MSSTIQKYIKDDKSRDGGDLSHHKVDLPIWLLKYYYTIEEVRCFWTPSRRNREGSQPHAGKRYRAQTKMIYRLKCRQVSASVSEREELHSRHSSLGPQTKKSCSGACCGCLERFGSRPKANGDEMIISGPAGLSSVRETKKKSFLR